MAEKIVTNYKHEIIFNNTPENVIGATTSITLREVDTIAGDTAFVRKFGTNYLITDVTDIEDPIDANMTFLVYALDGTLLGSRVGGGAFVSGSSVTAQGCYMEIEADGGNVTVLVNILVDTDVDPGGLDFVCAAETITNGDTLRLYLSNSASTYYDSEYIYGGDRHTPVLNSEDQPYFTINAALAAIITAHDDGVVVLDSAVYDEEIDWNLSESLLLAASGKNPTITRGIGARATRSTTEEYNNTTAIYFNENGSDSTGDGTWQNPYALLSYSWSNRGAIKNIVYGGDNADSGIIIDSVDFTNPIFEIFFIEADHKYTPTLKHKIASDYIIKLSDPNPLWFFKGFILDGDNLINGIAFDELATGSSQVIDNTITNCIDGIYDFDAPGTPTSVIIKYNKIFNNVNGMNFLHSITSIQIRSNNIFNNSEANVLFVQSVSEYDIILTNNVISNSLFGIKFGDKKNIGAIENNVIFNNATTGIVIFEQDLNEVQNNIFQNNGNGITTTNATTIDFNCFFNNTLDYNGAITSTNEILADPELCDPSNSKYGIQPISPCYRAGSDSDDIGIKTRIIEINESNITINGFIIDGQNGYSAGLFIVDTANHTDLIMKWCTVKRFIGGGGDMYDDDTALDIQILNCDFNNNGYGLGLHYGGNTVTECLFYRNSQQGLYCNQVTHIINHCVAFGNNYGFYFDTNAGGVSLKNSITNSNSTRGIFSVQSLIVTFMCITDAVDSTVNRTAESNITNNPLFINTTDGEENFNIKTVETGFDLNSACKDASDDTDFPDIGVYDVDRSLAQNSWRKYEFEFNPQVGWKNVAKGFLSFESINGTRDNFAKSHKRVFEFDFGDKGQVSSEELRQKMEYFAARMKTRENEIEDNEKVKFRLKLQPTTFLETGTAASVDASDKTLTDALKDWTENQWKGFHVGIKWDSGTNMVIDATAKTGTVGGAAWVVDEWIGYFVPLNGYYYYILSNTAAILTFSDPEETLGDIDGNLEDWAIEKYFKIESNSANQFCLRDDDSELVDGNYDYYIDFIECIVNIKTFGYTQPSFLYTNEKAKTGYKIIFEEI